MSTKSKKIKNNEFDKDMKELVKARLNVLPKNVSVSIGQEGTFNKEDNIGQKITQVEMEFLQAIKKGELYENPIDYQTGL